jgi:hypothetical protein
VPGSWAGTLANLVHYKRHDRGGHFAVGLKKRLVLECFDADAMYRLWRSQRSFLRMLKSGFQRHGRSAAAPNSERHDDMMNDIRPLSQRSDSRERTDRQYPMTKTKHASPTPHHCTANWSITLPSPKTGG